MIRFAHAALAAALLIATPAFSQDNVIHQGALNISGAFSRATLPNAPVGGGFMTIENTGTEADRLVSVSSDVAADAQIHEMALQNDIMKMRHLSDGIEIGAGETVVLSPGGYHIMFMKLKQPFVLGETVNVTLNFEKAGSVEVPLTVESTAADAPTPAGHNH
ncbi:copper chaperone PCu(A)C [Devosia sp. 2618]|uniref:copper chaperone PCu(A)C n=1 Tax=Devosia sp. 2618 TaxID=3156454 RepID=UPI00339867B4